MQTDQSIPDSSEKKINESWCEVPGCSLPGFICPACEQCFCWQHRQGSSCEACQKLLYRGSFEQRLGRLSSIGLYILLCGILFLLLPQDVYGTIIQLAILFLIVGSLLTWLGLLGRV